MITKNASNILRKLAYGSGDDTYYIDRIPVPLKEDPSIKDLIARKKYLSNILGRPLYDNSDKLADKVTISKHKYHIADDPDDVDEIGLQEYLDLLEKAIKTNDKKLANDAAEYWSMWAQSLDKKANNPIQDIIDNINTGELNKQLKDAETKGLRPASELYDIEEDILKGMKPAVRKQIKSVDYELGDGDFSVTLVDGNTGIYNIDDDIIF